MFDKTLEKNIYNKMAWSIAYEKCQFCGTTIRKHLAKGLCITCYYKSIEKNHRNPRCKRGSVSEKIDKTSLERMYINESKSLSDIAKILSCSRQFIYKKLKEYEIHGRSKTEARKLALDEGKIFLDIKSESGKTEKTVIRKHKVNENFFSNWSAEMAYVLGVIFTDGNLSFNRAPHAMKVYLRLSIAQKEPELLEKVLKLMNSDHTIRKRTSKNINNSSMINFFEIQNQ